MRPRAPDRRRADDGRHAEGGHALQRQRGEPLVGTGRLRHDDEVLRREQAIEDGVARAGEGEHGRRRGHRGRARPGRERGLGLVGQHGPREPPAGLGLDAVGGQSVDEPAGLGHRGRAQRVRRLGSDPPRAHERAPRSRVPRQRERERAAGGQGVRGPAEQRHARHRRRGPRGGNATSGRRRRDEQIAHAREKLASSSGPRARIGGAGEGIRNERQQARAAAGGRARAGPAR